MRRNFIKVSWGDSWEREGDLSVGITRIESDDDKPLSAFFLVMVILSAETLSEILSPVGDTGRMWRQERETKEPCV